MIVLHAAWLEPEHLLIWGEGGKRASTGRGVHPGAAGSMDIRTALAMLLRGIPDQADRIRDVAETQETLVVPDGKRTARWKVPGLKIPAASAMGWLAAVPRTGDEFAGATVGGDFAWCIDAALLVLELVARERFVPTASRATNGRLGGRWEPVLTAPGVAERVALLTRTMPEAVRAAAGMKTPRAALVRQWLRSGVDGVVRGVHDTTEPDGMADTSARGAAAEWLDTLGRMPASPRDTAHASAATAADLVAAVDRWTAPILGGEPPGSYRTGFSLESPQPADPHRWTVRFLLQPDGESGVVVPASILWRTPPPLPQKELALARDGLRAGVTRAGRLFPPIAEGLRAAQPSFVWLDATEAHRFLSETAPLLAEGGIFVSTPPWWGTPGTRLATSGVIRSLPAASGATGLDALVHLDLKLALGGAELTEQELLRLVSLKVPLVDMRGRWVEFRTEDIDAARVLLDRRRSSLTLGEALNRGLGGEAPGRLAVLNIESDGWIGQLLDTPRTTRRLEPVPLPATFHGVLRPYQARGLAWLDFFRRHGLHGCLADDMGLGKTVQTLALLLRHAGNGPSLLVCPTSVIGHWAREAGRFAPTLKVLVHDGPSRSKGRTFANAAGRRDLIITSYALLQRDQEALTGVRWDTVVLDELQNIKNADTRQSKAARSLLSRHRLGLTGTPVENHLTELWSLFEFLSPGYLGTKEGFRKYYATPIERWHSATHADRLRRLVAPFFLRRLKTDPGIAPELPARIESRETCRLTREQGTLYAGVVKAMLKKIEEAKGIQRKGLVLATLTRLKQVCDHPALAAKAGKKGTGDERVRSGKLARLEEILREVVDEGQRALVFTQYATMGAMLQRRLAGILPGEVLFLHGGTSRREREELIRTFQDPVSSARVFILSLKAGGTGLNLTAASHVIHYDRWWNPAVEAQASDRAHRIGQTKAVQIHMLVCQGTLEEKIDALIESKKRLAATVTGGEAWLTELSNAQIKSLVALDANALAEEW